MADWERETGMISPQASSACEIGKIEGWHGGMVEDGKRKE